VSTATFEGRAPVRPTRAAATALAATAAAAGCFAVLGPSALDLIAAAVVGLLVWLAALDLEFRLLPNRIVLPATVVVLLLVAAVAPAEAPGRALAALGAALLLFVAARARPGGLGMGDVKLALLLGATLGAGVVTALAVGFGAAGLVGLALLARSGRGALRTQLPLAPFLAVGAIVALLG
jgi:leader peptidase (prepilin peptidase)/N-methyltransferase